MRRAVLAAFVLALTQGSLPDLEQRFLDLRELHDRLRIAAGRGAEKDTDGTPVAQLRTRFAALHRELSAGLSHLDRSKLTRPDQDALQTLSRILKDGTVPEPDDPGSRESKEATPDCSYDAVALARRKDGLSALKERIYDCYSQAARHVSFEGGSYDRLTILEMAGRAEDPVRRRQLFLALEPVFRSVNGDNGAASPYRAMLPQSAAEWAKSSPIARNLVALGITPDKLEPWLVSILEAWRDATGSAEIEPWDYEYEGYAGGRGLAERLPRERLKPLNDAFYRTLGADVDALHVHYDLESREGKTAVAFTDFGARPRLRSGAWTTGEPWVFATYGAGGLGNLAELLHETGHAVHIAAIRTRPAYADWPDSDTFTEAIADLAALEMYEPAWQRRFLGAAAPLDASLRAKYAGIVMDVAWSLFEIRAHRNPEMSPNRIWTDITSRYLRIRPHPEWSWWAMRGQLVNSPGYMMNYAFGAILIADIRARLVARRGAFTTGDPGWYPWVSQRLYRFGLERPSRSVVRDFLGRSVAVGALLGDLARLAPRNPPTLITAARLLDVERGALVHDAGLLIEGERIVASGPRAGIRVPAGARRLDLGQVTLLPGLIDAHVHLTLAGPPRANAEATL